MRNHANKLAALFILYASLGAAQSTVLTGTTILTGTTKLGACLPGGPPSYATSFPLTQAPINECGTWNNGLTQGLVWTNVATTSGLAFGTESPTSGVFDDSTATLTGTWTANQGASAVVKAPTSGSSTQDKEVELRLNTAIAANSITGYEIDFTPFQSTPANCGLSVAKWLGPIGSFTSINNGTGSQFCLSTGNTIRATQIGNSINVYVNELLVAGPLTDSSYTNGSPGVGFYVCCTSAVANDFGLSSFYGTDSPIYYAQGAALDTTANATTVVASMGSNTTTGNAMQCVLYWANQSLTASVADIANGSYTADPNGKTNGAGELSAYSFEMFYKLNITGATTPAITATLSGSASTIDRGIACHEFGGVSTLDQHPAPNVSTGTSMSSATTGTTSNANEYLLGWCVIGNTLGTITSPWTQRLMSTWGLNATADRSVTATGAYTFQATQTSASTNNYVCGIDTYY